MDLISFKSVCWDITSKCNDYCTFCYREVNNSDLSLIDNKVILQKLLDYGIEKISFVGGEPLLYKDLFELIAYGKSIAKKNVVFSITTNGILLTENERNSKELHLNEDAINKLINHFDWITLSLDYAETEGQTLFGRNDLHFERVKLILDYINKINVSNKIKINTIVAKKNINFIYNVLSFISQYNIKRWKLFKFLPSRGIAKKNGDIYDVSQEEFDNCINQVKTSPNLNGIKLSINDYLDFSKSYITISADGFLCVFDGKDYEKKLNLLTDNYSLIAKYIDSKIHNERRTEYLDN